MKIVIMRNFVEVGATVYQCIVNKQTHALLYILNGIFRPFNNIPYIHFKERGLQGILTLRKTQYDRNKQDAVFIFTLEIFSGTIISHSGRKSDRGVLFNTGRYRKQRRIQNFIGNYLGNSILKRTKKRMQG
jgi:hypothetical protein